MQNKTPEKTAPIRTAHAAILLILTILIFAGCAPVISDTALKGVDRNLTFAEIIKTPSQHKGAAVLLGGRVIGVSNRENITLVEVLQFPLSRGMRPRSRKGSKGRFILRVNGFLDPLVFKGRLITTAGILGEPMTRPLGKAQYTYPVIESREFHIWKFRNESSSPITIGIGLGISGGY